MALQELKAQAEERGSCPPSNDRIDPSNDGADHVTELPPKTKPPSADGMFTDHRRRHFTFFNSTNPHPKKHLVAPGEKRLLGRSSTFSPPYYCFLFGTSAGMTGWPLEFNRR